jgi:hypothetical protein
MREEAGFRLLRNDYLCGTMGKKGSKDIGWDCTTGRERVMFGQVQKS